MSKFTQFFWTATAVLGIGMNTYYLIAGQPFNDYLGITSLIALAVLDITRTPFLGCSSGTN